MGADHQAIRFVIVAILCLWACGEDLRRRRIPNWLTVGAAVGAVVFSLLAEGLPGGGLAVAGWATGAALLFPWFALGGMGAGDVKLVAALGAWLGPWSALWVVLYTAVAGGVLAVIVSLAHGYLRTAFRNLWRLLGYWRVVGVRPLPELTLNAGKGPRLPYAVPIAIGTLVTLWLR
jgi:prepilin peptidase CpaA